MLTLTVFYLVFFSKPNIKHLNIVTGRKRENLNRKTATFTLLINGLTEVIIYETGVKRRW